MTLDESDRFLNRELSWLAFNERVLALAAEPSTPLLERAKFVAIFSRNLDEFFQVRVAGLKKQVTAGITAASVDGRSPSEQLFEIQQRVDQLTRVQQRLYTKEIRPELAAEGIQIVDWGDLSLRARKKLREYYEAQIQPALTPLAVDPAHPFPWISNLSLNLGLFIKNEKKGPRRFARVKVPAALPRLLPLDDGKRWLPIEQLIAAEIGDLFPGMKMKACHIFRVTRDAALPVDEGDDDDLLAVIESGLHRRLRVNDAVRLEMETGASEAMCDLLVDELELSYLDVYPQRSLIDLSCLWQLYRSGRPELKDRRWRATTQSRLRPVSDDEEQQTIFSVMQDGDVLVHHPYDSFATSIEEFVTSAAKDPAVVTIKHTLYRTAGRQNNLLRALKQAAKSGKEVVVLVEITARFDEESNIEWARDLESAGVNVVYGMVGLKTHGKVVLVVRREGNELQRYCHIGTGNYNPETARLYEDIGLLTASDEIGADVGELFNYMTGYSDPVKTQHLLLAPDRLRPELLDLIEQTSAKPGGHITMKVNGLSDPEIIDALYTASQAGTQVDLIVRSVCCLIPQKSRLSENIRVRSVVGRFLEHSRIFRFINEGEEDRLYVGSADMMTRNLDSRIEVVTPILEEALKGRIRELLDAYFDPAAQVWELGANGRWKSVSARDGFNVQKRFQELARKH